MRKTSLSIVLFVAASLLGVAVGPAQAAPNDPRWDKQWGPKQILAEQAWTKTKGAGVIISIVDSGVDVDHPDLKAKLVPGYDYGDNDDNPDDDSPLKDGAGVEVIGHGTHVAGTAAAITDNGEGVAGVAPNAKIMPMKVFPSKSGTLAAGIANVPRAISDSVARGAKVINLSLGGFQGLSLVGTIETPCFNAFRQGALCVVAAGNSGRGKPSGYDKDVSFLNVTANDESRTRATFGQNADTKWAISAPGVAILSTYPIEKGSYQISQGTSMAAPHAAGAAALLFAQGLDAQQVVDRLLNNATPSSDGGMGRGILNVGAASGAAPPPKGSDAATNPGGTPKSGASKGSTGSGSRSGGGTDDGFGAFDDDGTTATTLPGQAADDGSFDDFGASSENVEADQASSTRDKAEGVDSTVMLGVLAAFLLLGVAVPAVQQWGRRGAVRA